MADVTRNNAEQGMGFRSGDGSMLAIEEWGTAPKFCEQVFPFVKQLTLVLIDQAPEFARGDFARVEAISTPLSFH